MANFDFSHVKKDPVIEKLDGDLAKLKEINQLGEEVKELVDRNMEMWSSLDMLDKKTHDLWKLLMDDSAKLSILYSRLSEAYFKLYG